MFDLELDTEQWVKRTEELGAAIDQLPFVLMQLMNDAVFKARRVLVETTWPTHVTVRNKTFLTASLRVMTARKDSLAVAIYDALQRGHLQEHARGGTVRPFRARKFAIPQTGIRRTAHGVAAGQSPTAIIASTPKRALRITSTGIFVGEAGKLHLKYSLRPQVDIAGNVPFYEDFEYTMTNAMRTGFDDAMRKAMETRH